MKVALPLVEALGPRSPIGGTQEPLWCGCVFLFFFFFFPTPRLIDAHISIIHSAPDELLKRKVWFYVFGYSIFNAERSWEDGNSGAVRKETFIHGQLASVTFMFGGEMILCCFCVVQSVKHEVRHDPPEQQVFTEAHR